LPILRVKGFEAFRMCIYTRGEHPWPHVHVKNGANEVAVIKLGSRRRLPEFDTETWTSMSKRDMRIALDLVTDNQRKLLKMWRDSRPIRRGR